MANILTGMRILCGILIMCFPAFSGWYYLFYLIGGFTDAIDGTVARKTGTASDFGSKFDTMADFVFAVAIGLKIIRRLYVPLWLIIWIAIIAFIKIGSHFVGYFKYRKFKAVHSGLNKMCGGTVFLVILLIGFDYAWQVKALAVIGTCVFASFAAVSEAVTIFHKQER